MIEWSDLGSAWHASEFDTPRQCSPQTCIVWGKGKAVGFVWPAALLVCRAVPCVHPAWARLHVRREINCRQKKADLKNYAAPVSRMPAVTDTANDWRAHDDWCRCDNNRSPRCDYDWPVRATMSIRTTVKAGTTSALSTGALDADE